METGISKNTNTVPCPEAAPLVSPHYWAPACTQCSRDAGRATLDTNKRKNLINSHCVQDHRAVELTEPYFARFTMARLNNHQQPRCAAIILAGGKSSRIQTPYPKCLLPLHNGTVLDSVITTIRRAGIKQIVIVTPAADRLIRQHTKNQYRYAPMASWGTAYAARGGLTALPRTTTHVLIAMADSSSQFKPQTIRRFIHTTAKKRASIGITLFKAVSQIDSIGRILLDKHGNSL